VFKLTLSKLKMGRPRSAPRHRAYAPAPSASASAPARRPMPFRSRSRAARGRAPHVRRARGGPPVRPWSGRTRACRGASWHGSISAVITPPSPLVEHTTYKRCPCLPAGEHRATSRHCRPRAELELPQVPRAVQTPFPLP
jgi:hypothetical protein